MDPDPSASLFVLASLSPLTLGLEFGILLILLALSALISGSEVALFTLQPSDADAMRERTDSASRRVLALFEQRHVVLNTILILNTVVNVGAATLAALIVGQLTLAYGWDERWVYLVEIIVLTLALLILSEITPKITAANHATRYIRFVSGPLSTVHAILRPISRLLNRFTRLLRRRLPAPDPLSGEDLKMMAEVGEAHGSLEEAEREWIHSIVDLNETSVREVMVSRLDINAIHNESTLHEAFDVIRESGNSRLPLYREHLDNLLGILYAKDLLPLLGRERSNGSSGNGAPIDWQALARPALFVPPNKKLDDLLRDFQQKRTHIAIVVDEYGGTAGLVTLEDILEEIVGDIRDEHDEAEPDLYERVGEHAFRFDAKVDLDDLNTALEALYPPEVFPPLETDTFDFETLGGLVFHLTETIPDAGATTSYGPLELTVESVQNHRIGDVLVRVAATGEPVEVERRNEDERLR